MEKTTIIDYPEMGIIQVKYRRATLVEVFYCDDNGDAAKKLATKIAHKIEKSTIIETEKGFKLLKRERNNNDQR